MTTPRNRHGAHRRGRTTRRLLGLLLLGVAPALRAQSPAREQAQEKEQARGDTLVVATYAYGTVDRRGAIAPLATVIASSLQRPVRVMVAPDPVALVDSVRTGRADVIVTNTFGYLLLAEGPSPAGVAVATFRVPAGAHINYSAVLVTRHPALQTVEDLSRYATRLRVALVSAGSTTGNLLPRLALAGHRLDDLDRQMAGVHYAGTHARAFQALCDGDADVAGLALEEYERQLAALPVAERAEYRVLWSSPDIMLGPVAVRRDLPEALRDAIARALVGLETRAPYSFIALRGGWTEARVTDRLIAAIDMEYDVVRRLFGQSSAVTALMRRLSR